MMCVKPIIIISELKVFHCSSVDLGGSGFTSIIQGTPQQRHESAPIPTIVCGLSTIVPAFVACKLGDEDGRSSK